MKRYVSSLALALLVLGCGRSYERDHLITGPPGYSSPGGCFTSGATGLLTVDPVYGTAIIDEAGPVNPNPVMVAWRPGFTSRQKGSEVEVLDPEGTVVAITGKRYAIMGGYVPAGGNGAWPVWPDLPTHVFWACGGVTPVP